MFKFLKAARSLVNQGMSKEAIEQFAKNEFGEINELFQKQIDNLFKQKQGIENIKIKDEVFDDTIVKLPIDDTGVPFNPKDPMKQYGKPKKTDDFNLSEDDPLGDLEKIIKGEGDTGLPKKPRTDKYTGGMVDVEPNLSDIGHGSDSLMARTRLISPNNQATTSTGLNYLLAEDNDNIRVPFAKGKGVDLLRRGFLKTIGTAGAGLAALKSGILGFGKEAAPVVEKAVETVSETAQNVPPYFLNLVNKIKNLGSKFDGPKERAESYRYKDYEMDIDLDTGAIDIKKTREAMIPGYDEAGVAEEVNMTYKPGMIDETTKGKKTIDEYEEFTARPDMDGKMKDVEGGVPDEVIEEGTMFEDNIKDFGKAEGGLTTMLGE